MFLPTGYQLPNRGPKITLNPKPQLAVATRSKEAQLIHALKTGVLGLGLGAVGRFQVSTGLRISPCIRGLLKLGGRDAELILTLLRIGFRPCPGNPKPCKRQKIALRFRIQSLWGLGPLQTLRLLLRASSLWGIFFG